MRLSRDRFRTATSSVAAGLLVGAALCLTACGAGGGEPTTQPSAGVTVDRPSRDDPQAETTPTDDARSPRSREPDRTTAPAETATRPATPDAGVPPQPAQTTRTTAPADGAPPPAATPPAATPPAATPPAATPPAATPPAATPSASQNPAAAADSGGIPPFGWLMLIGFVVAIVVGGLLVFRSQQRTAWDAEARTLEAETRTVTTTRLPPVLSATNTGQLNREWPPVRATLVGLTGRWNALTERASGESRRNWSLQISGLLQDLIVALDDESEALATGSDWMQLRPHVRQAERALATVLAPQPEPAAPPPPATGEPRPPDYAT
jgi:hypothetical protein